MIWADSISYTNFMYNKQRMKKLMEFFCEITTVRKNKGELDLCFSPVYRIKKD